MSININPIETYVPTIYVNNSEPDLDETNLNHAEQALKRVTDAANAAILALESLDSAKIDAAKIVNNLLATDTSTVLSGPMGKALGDRLTAAENLLTKLNGDSENLKKRVSFPNGVSGDVLEFAESCGVGITFFYTLNESTNRPTNSSAYATAPGLVIKRQTSGNITVMLFNCITNLFSTNSKSLDSWTGWRER